MRKPSRCAEPVTQGRDQFVDGSLHVGRVAEVEQRRSLVEDKRQQPRDEVSPDAWGTCPDAWSTFQPSLSAPVCLSEGQKPRPAAESGRRSRRVQARFGSQHTGVLGHTLRSGRDRRARSLPARIRSGPDPLAIERMSVRWSGTHLCECRAMGCDRFRFRAQPPARTCRPADPGTRGGVCGRSRSIR